MYGFLLFNYHLLDYHLIHSWYAFAFIGKSFELLMYMCACYPQEVSGHSVLGSILTTSFMKITLS